MDEVFGDDQNSREAVQRYHKKVKNGAKHKITDEERAAWARYSLVQQRANPSRKLVISARARAKRRGISFSITAEHVLVPTNCPVCGVNLELGGNWRTSPSLDRLYNDVGYTKDNVWVLCGACNKLKNNASERELYRLADAIYAEKKRRAGAGIEDREEV